MSDEHVSNRAPWATVGNSDSDIFQSVMVCTKHQLS